MDVREALYDQLAKDMACSVQEVRSRDNVFTVAGRSEEMRRGEQFADSPLHIICINGKILARSENREIITWLKEKYSGFPGAWLAAFTALRELNDGLGRFGLCIRDCKPYFIPDSRWSRDSSAVIPGEYQLNWYHDEEILPFKGDPRFQEAIVFDEAAPDRIALTASRDGNIAAMVGANSESAGMWQMGVNVLPGHEAQGLGVFLTELVKEAILAQGVLPYYGTATSHTISQRIAIRAGFVPAFTELLTMKLDNA